MIILNILEAIKINLKNSFDNFIEHCLLILQLIIACSSRLITITLDIIERRIHPQNKMDQMDAPNDREDEREANEENEDFRLIAEQIDMLVDDEDLDRIFFELRDADFDDDVDDDGEVDDVDEVDQDDLDDVDDFDPLDEDDVDEVDQDDIDDPLEDDDDVDDDDDGDAEDNELDISSDNENDCNMNVSEDEEMKKLRDIVLRVPMFDKTYYRKKPMYQFKPYHLVKDNFSNKSHVNSSIPAARSGHRITADSGNLYSLGGYNPRSTTTVARNDRCELFQELWCYNFATRHWKIIMNASTMPNMPRELASNALVMHNKILISYGGTGFPFGESCSNDCYVFSKNREKPFLTRLEVSGELPTPLYGPAIVIHGDYLYTIGGTTGFEYSCDVFRLNFKTRQWESMYISRPEMRDDPEGRYRHEIVYDEKYIYVLGGGTSTTVYDLQRIPAFNLNTNRWEFFDTLPDRTVVMEAAAAAAEAPGELVGFPKPRKCFSCVQHKMDNGDILAFISGGLQGDFNTYFNDVWKLNLRTMQWTCIKTAQLPKALYFHAATDNGNGMMYIFGGIEYDEGEMRRRNRVYKMWMTIPKLSEMCWEAITYYNDYLCTHSTDALISYGIPKRFADRVEYLPNVRRHPTASKSTMACTSL